VRGLKCEARVGTYEAVKTARRTRTVGVPVGFGKILYGTTFQVVNWQLSPLTRATRTIRGVDRLGNFTGKKKFYGFLRGFKRYPPGKKPKKGEPRLGTF